MSHSIKHGKKPGAAFAVATLLFLDLGVMVSHGQSFSIVGFQNSGDLQWQSTNASGCFRIEWAPQLDGNWRTGWDDLRNIAPTGQVMSAKVPIFYRVIFEPFQSTSNSMISVPYEAADKIYYLANSNAFMNGYGSYNKGGPEYAFHMSKYEVSNAEFVFFLNDAQIHTNDSRGKFLVFNSDGKVGLGSDTTMFFDITKSRLAYDSLQPIGERYSVSADSPSGGGSFANHPVTGVSWYGAVKYCNWLTIASGIGEGERCYTEGGGAASWKPTTASVWGVDPFVDSQRSNWLSYAGYRLPMLFSAPYNEAWKVASWNGLTNTFYANGTNVINSLNANYFQSGDPFDNSTTPVGYYDGSSHEGIFATSSNLNKYGVYDLSGNVSEWFTEFFPNLYDAPYGGSYSDTAFDQHWPYHGGSAYLPNSCQVSVGFRVVRVEHSP